MANDDAPSGGFTRRTLLRGAATVAAGGAAVAAWYAAWKNRTYLFLLPEAAKQAQHADPSWSGSAVRSYRPLGKTGIQMSDISFGGASISDAEVVARAVERGINYFDTSPDYSQTGSEQVIGAALKPHRDKVHIASKFCTAEGHLAVDTPVADIVAAVESSLRRLQTDYLDVVIIHEVNGLDRLMAANFHEAFDRLKQQGKARFLGVSTHTPNLEEVANAAIDSGRFDVMMLAYHFGMWPSFGHILEKAKKNDVAVVAMKTLKGAKHTNLAEFRNEQSAYSQAAFRWVLSNPNVACLVVSFKEQQHVDEYLFASGTALHGKDVAMLDRYDELTRGDYCQPHCGRCLDSCEYSLPINDILRYRMYFKDYGWEKEGMRHYAKLDRNASVCASCSAPCAGQCPIGVPIREKMMDAHRQLTFSV